MKNSLNHFWIGIALVILTSLLAGRYLLLPGYFAMHDDLQVMRQYEMERCFQDGQIPCRWSPDLGAGYGFPMFNYYSPLPNYFGMPFRWVGFSYIDTAKSLFLLSLVGSVVFMYILIYSLTASVSAATTSAILYTWAPYHLLDIFVRGALAESWALMWLPLILWSIWQLSVKPHKQVSLPLTLSLTGLLLSHNITSMLFIPVIIVWSILLFFINKPNLKSYFSNLLISSILVFGLSAFFVIPALAEKHFVHSDTLTSDYFDFRHHFVAVKQLFFDRTWGYGPSRPGPEDGMSFQLGWPHWWVVILGVSYLIWWLVGSKFKTQSAKLQLKTKNLATHPPYTLNPISYILPLCFFVLLFLVITFLTHAKSIFIWEAFPFLAWTQFPWRLLGIAILAASVVGGFLIAVLPSRWQWPTAGFFILITVVLNWSYSPPTGYDSTITDDYKLTGEEWNKQRKGAYLDYLPQTVKTFEIHTTEHPVTILTLPNSLSSDEERAGESLTGLTNAIWKNWHQRSDAFEFDIENYERIPLAVQASVFAFPGWQIYINDHQIDYQPSDPLGLITFNVPGEEKIHIAGYFRNTPIRTLANTLTVLSYTFLVYLIFSPKLNFISSPQTSP